MKIPLMLAGILFLASNPTKACGDRCECCGFEFVDNMEVANMSDVLTLTELKLAQYKGASQGLSECESNCEDYTVELENRIEDVRWLVTQGEPAPGCEGANQLRALAQTVCGALGKEVPECQSAQSRFEGLGCE